MRRTVVILVAGASLTVAGCRAGREEPNTTPHSEPAEATEEGAQGDETEAGVEGEPGTMLAEATNTESAPIRTSNPPPPGVLLPKPSDVLPTWEEAASGHPEGATNPPIPVLAIHPEGTECFKEWYDPREVPEQARATGARIMTEGESSEGTQVQCPQERVDALLEQ